jgi:hypothetical protein
MQLGGVSAPIEDPALVPAPVPTVDTLGPVPVPEHSFGCGIVARLHPSFSRNRFHAHTVVLDRSHRAIQMPKPLENLPSLVQKP